MPGSQSLLEGRKEGRMLKEFLGYEGLGFKDGRIV